MDKTLILKWLCELFGYKDYPHSFKDQWILPTIWNGILSISFDSRVEEHNKLISLIPAQFMGTVQYKSLKIVNKKTFYVVLDRLGDIKYPNIIKSVLKDTTKHAGGSGGWTSESDAFYTYDWEVFLDDDTSIMYNNQKDVMDMVKGDFIYNKIIQERWFINFLTNLNS